MGARLSTDQCAPAGSATRAFASASNIRSRAVVVAVENVKSCTYQLIHRTASTCFPVSEQSASCVPPT